MTDDEEEKQVPPLRSAMKLRCFGRDDNSGE
jgi:hypothetical protein